MKKHFLFHVLWFCLILVASFTSCKKEEPVVLPEETSLEVLPQININEPLCYNLEVYYTLHLASKDLIGIKSLEIIRNGAERLLYFTDLEAELSINWFYQTREDDINNLVTLEFILTDEEDKVVKHLSGFDVIEDFNYVSPAFTISTAYDLKNNIPINIGNPLSDLIISSETESCGDNCLKNKHTIYTENNIEMYSFPDDFYWSVDHRALKEQEIRDAIEEKEPLSEIVAYTSFESELDETQLYINNTPLILLIGEQKDICIFQIADPIGLWRYKKKEIFTGQ